MKEIEKPWLEVGYRDFAYKGPTGLKIQRLAEKVGKNKSSFYHLFANVDLFTNRLLSYHLIQAKIIIQKEANSKNEPELIKILVEHKIDLLFNRQLRIHRSNPDFEGCFTQINHLSIPAIIPVWKKIIGLNENSSLAQMVFYLSLENFYLQITDETLTESWLINYFDTVRQMVHQFKNSSTIPTLDASV